MPDVLIGLGLDERTRALFAERLAGGLVPGRVVRLDKGGSLVLTEDGPVRAEPSGRFLSRTANAEAFPAVGDWVALRVTGDPGPALVEEVLPRSSAFIREDPREAAEAQVLAANIDTVFIVHALSGDPKLARVERELVLAWESGARPVVVLNKADLCPDAQERRAAIQVLAPDVPVHVTSALEGTGLSEIAEYLEDRRTVVLLGPSGVGKSMIVNRLAGSDLQKIAEVRASDEKGRHTTAARELFRLPCGGIVIDTPGLRALALWEADEGIARAFSDIEEIATGCRFRDCRHQKEPGCAVKAAVEEGTLPGRRLESYRALKKELDSLAARRDERDRRGGRKSFGRRR